MTKVAMIVLSAACAFAQPQQPAPGPELVRKVIDIKHLTGERAERAMSLLRAYMQPVGIVTFEPSLKTAVIIGPEKIVTGAEALLAKFDSPGVVRPDRQVHLRIHLIEASPDGTSGPMPAEIAPAVEQMKKNFAYKGYRLIDTLTAVGKDEMRAEANLPGIYPERPDIRSLCDLRVASASVLEDGKTVALRKFRFNLRIPIVMRIRQNELEVKSFTDTNIATDLTIQAGQKLVVGKLSAEQPLNAVFLIVTGDVQ